MTRKQIAELQWQLRDRTPRERQLMEEGLFHALEVASDANIEVGELPQIYEVLRGLIHGRVGRRPYVKPKYRWGENA